MTKTVRNPEWDLERRISNVRLPSKTLRDRGHVDTHTQCQQRRSQHSRSGPLDLSHLTLSVRFGFVHDRTDAVQIQLSCCFMLT
jgi:hypothetical protein